METTPYKVAFLLNVVIKIRFDQKWLCQVNLCKIQDFNDLYICHYVFLSAKMFCVDPVSS